MASVSGLDPRLFKLDVIGLLAGAIHEHRKRHDGDMPRKIVMHPQVYCHLVNDDRIRSFMNWGRGRPDDFTRFHGVLIEQCPKTIGAKMITARGVVESL